MTTSIFFNLQQEIAKSTTGQPSASINTFISSLLTFFGHVHIAYLPHDGYVAGFSKFVKLVEIFSHRPQLQERMTREIADEIERALDAEGVMVIVEAQQQCMTMRGDLAQGTKTVTAECRGSLEQGQALSTQAWMMLMHKSEA